MSKAIITESLLTDIADAIRSKLGGSDTYTPAEMAAAIMQIASTLVAKTITQNGTYYPSDDDADGYSSVTVNIPGAPVLVPKTIAAKGVYDPTDDNADGYSLVTVTAGGDHPSVEMELLTPPVVGQLTVSLHSKFRPVVTTEVNS